MKTIEIVVNGKHAQNPSGCIVCDNSDYQIKFVFDDEWSYDEYKTARFNYNGVKEEKTFTGDTVDVPAIRSPGILSVGVYTNDLATTPAEIKCCPSIKSKGGKVPEPEGNVYEQVITLLNTLDVNKVSEEVAKAYEMLNVVSNAVTGKASGSAIRMDDVSPIEHTVKCKVSSKNLIPFPYYQSSSSANGGTITVQDDSGILFEGTPTGYVGMVVYKGEALVKSGEITMSINGTATNVILILYMYDSSGTLVATRSTTNTIVLNIDSFPTVTDWNITCARAVSNEEISGVMYPQIEEGNTATEFMPYVNPADVTVTRNGKNLLDLSRATFSFATYNEAVNGLTCKINNSYYAGARVDYLNDFLLANKGKTLTFSIGEAIEGATITLLIYGTRTSGKTNQEGSTTGKREISFAITDEFTAITGLEVRVNRFTTAFTDTTTVVRNMQVEVSDTATDFEAYKESATYTPDADGTVDGVKSISPTMTLLTDTAGVLIEAEYNRDINKVIAKLEAQTS